MRRSIVLGAALAGLLGPVLGAQPGWAAPRRASQVRAAWLWDLRSPELLYPSDVHVSGADVLVFDHGAHTLRIVDPRTRRLRANVGRRGRGPGEFEQPVQLFGTRDRPLLLEFSRGRVSAWVDGSLRPERVPEVARWGSGCVLGENDWVLQAGGRPTHDLFVVTPAPEARVRDSFPVPWPRLQSRPFLERQAALRQVDDSTCGLLPLYQREFALLQAGRAPLLGTAVEALPSPLARRDSSGVSWRDYLSGAKPGAVDMRGWRGMVLVLFGGQTSERFRLMDVYRRNDLQYTGSFRLRYPATRLAVSGDTLYVLGEVADEPVLTAYHLRER